MPESLQSILETARDKAIDYAPSVASAIAILFFGWIAAKIIRGVIRKLLRRARLDDTLASFVCSLAYMGFLLFVIIAGLGKLGVDTNSFVALVGAAGLAVGFALQGSLANFAAGVMLIIFRPFKLGDFVEAGGVSGAVDEIQIFATILKTPDNKRIIVPNSAITGGNIINYSANPTRRVDLVFGIGYDDDIAQAKKVLEDILAAEDRVMKDPAPTIAVSELADSSVNFVVRPWVATSDYWSVYFDLTEKVKVEFDRLGISIPYPQRDIHLHQVGEAPAA